MAVAFAAIQQGTILQLPPDLRIGVLDPLAREVAHRVDERAVALDGHQCRQTVGPPNFHVVLAERRGDMDDACTVFDADERAAIDHVSVILAYGQVLEQRLVMLTEQVLAFHLLDDVIMFRVLERLADQRFSQDKPFGGTLRAVLRRTFDHHVVDVRADGDCHVAGQRPGRRRPDQERRVLLTIDREAYIDARIIDILVSIRDLVAAQRRTAACAIRHDLVVLEQQILIPILLEDPPHALDVLVLECDVSVVQVYPEAHALGQLFPVFEIAQDTFAALPVELRDSIFLDLALMLEAEFFFDFDLNWQTVRIPAAFTQYVMAGHNLVTREDILERTRQHVMDTGSAIRRRRSFVKDVARPLFTLRERALERFILPPESKLLLLQLWDVHAGRYRTEFHITNPTSSCRSP